MWTGCDKPTSFLSAGFEGLVWPTEIQIFYFRKFYSVVIYVLVLQSAITSSLVQPPNQQCIVLQETHIKFPTHIVGHPLERNRDQSSTLSKQKLHAQFFGNFCFQPFYTTKMEVRILLHRVLHIFFTHLFLKLSQETLYYKCLWQLVIYSQRVIAKISVLMLCYLIFLKTLEHWVRRTNPKKAVRQNLPIKEMTDYLILLQIK